MKLLSRITCALCVAAAVGVSPMVGADEVRPRGWEAVEPPGGTAISPSADFDATTQGNFVYLQTRRKVKVALFSVLGQSLTRTTLSQGCYRFRIASRGIYILRVDSSTFRITI